MSELMDKLPDEMVNKLQAVLGSKHVCTSPEQLDRYSRCTIPWQSRCAGVVFPESTNEVAEVVRLAKRHQIPIWMYSTGKNWGYGATLAPDKGVLVMILERMNRILEVNEELAYAVVEPGVTYEQLNAYLKQKKIDLWTDCIDGTSKGSVIGNALDRGVGETPYGDHFGNLCGLEVVLPSSEIVHTGGAVSGSKTWNVHKWGIGPYLEGLFSQSNFGIVTKAGIWLMPKPEAYNSYVFEIREEKHIPKVMDAFRRLALQGLITTKLHMINGFVSLSILTQRIHEDVSPKGNLSKSELARLQKKYGVSPWYCGGGIYGTKGQVRLQRRLLHKALGSYGRLIFISDSRLVWIERLLSWSWKSPALKTTFEKLSGTSLKVLESAPHLHDILQGIPSDYFAKHAYYRNRVTRPDQDYDPARDRCGLIWFAPILPYTTKDILPYLEISRNKIESYGFDFYVAMLLLNPRAVICLMAIIYDKDDEDETVKARQLYDELLSEMKAKQYQQYRAGLLAWDSVFEAAPEVLNLNNKIKAALDPDNILAPGRYGIDGKLR